MSRISSIAECLKSWTLDSVCMILYPLGSATYQLCNFRQVNSPLSLDCLRIKCTLINVEPLEYCLINT